MIDGVILFIVLASTTVAHSDHYAMFVVEDNCNTPIVRSPEEEMKYAAA